MASAAGSPASSGLGQWLGRRWPPRLLLRLEKQAQGMPDDLIPTGLETDARLQRIEIAVECVEQSDGDTHRQHTGGVVSCGTSSGHRGPPGAIGSMQTEVKQGHSREEFIQKIFFVNKKQATGKSCGPRAMISSEVPAWRHKQSGAGGGKAHRL